MASKKKTKKKSSSKRTARKKTKPTKKKQLKQAKPKKLQKKSAPPKARKKTAPKKKASVRKRSRSGSSRQGAFSGSRTARHSGDLAGDLQGLSRREAADSESVDELIEEGNAFEADAVMGVEEADNMEGREVHTREVPEDDVPGEYLDED